jgi:hypothetical protein
MELQERYPMWQLWSSTNTINTLQARWGTAEEVVVQASHLVIEQAWNHPLTVSQKHNPKIS